MHNNVGQSLYCLCKNIKHTRPKNGLKYLGHARCPLGHARPDLFVQKSSGLIHFTPDLDEALPHAACNYITNY